MDRAKQLETLLVIVVALVVLYFIKKSQWWLVAALVVGVLGLLSPWFGLVLNRGWMWLAKVMGEVSGRVLLTIVYLFLLVPIAVVARRLGKVGLRRKPDGDTCFTERGHTYKKEDLIHPW